MEAEGEAIEEAHKLTQLIGRKRRAVLVHLLIIDHGEERRARLEQQRQQRRGCAGFGSGRV